MIKLVDRPFIKRTIILLPVLLLAFCLRLEKLGNAPVRWDEAYSVWEAQMGLSEVTEFTARDVHPPIYFWLLHVWLRLVGSSEFAIRILSVFPGLITILLVYAITWHMSRQRLAALLALLLITVSPFHITWSQDARMYALATMFSALTIYAYWRRRPGLLALAGTGATLSHYYGGFVVGIIVIYEIIFRREQGMARRQWYRAIAAIVLVCIVWGAYAVGLIRRDPSLATFDPPATFVLMANVFAANAASQTESLTLAAQVILLVFFAGLLLNWRDNPRRASFIILGCLLPPVAITLLSLPVVPVHVNELKDRHFNLFAPFVYAGFGTGLAAMLKRRRLLPVGFIIIAGLLVFQTSVTLSRSGARYFRDDFRSMMAAVAALTTADDHVFVITGRHVPYMGYHMDRVGYDVPRNADSSRNNVVGIPTRSSDVPAMMEWVVAGFPRFWVIEVEAHMDEPHLSPEGPIERIDWIEATHERLYQIQHGHYNSIDYYSRVEGEIFDRNVDTLIPPFVSEARPGDFVRIGVPAGSEVNLVHDDQVLETQNAETWRLLQFYVHSHYANGNYALKVNGGESYPFTVTHSQAAG